MKLHQHIATSEAGFVFNPTTGDSFAASPLAAEVLELLKAGHSPVAIQAALLARYEVSASQLQRDLDDFLAQLRLFKLVADS